jgi:hypothetical protein
MRIIAAISSPEQDDVIERILRQANGWHPSWKVQQKARAPPAPRTAQGLPRTAHCQSLGIRPFDHGFYGQPALLVENANSRVPVLEKSLAAAQARMSIQVVE